MRQQSDEKLRHVGVYVPESLYEKLAETAKKQRRSISSTVVLFIEGGIQAIIANPPWDNAEVKKKTK